MTLIVPSYAKLNLFLHITGKQDDGYHSIQSVFYRIDLADRLRFCLAPQQSSLIELDDPTQSTQFACDNLVVKAAHLLAKFAKTHCQQATLTPIHIHLDKNIPTGAGLGGGSSNAATVLVTLNQLWQLNLPTNTLQALGQALGADVPFFVADVPCAKALGIGEQLTAIDLPKIRFFLLSPDVHHTTQTFFAHPELVKNTPIIERVCPQDFLWQHNPPYHNAFESIALQSPQVACAMDYLQKLATHTTPRLTGTGSTVFLPIPETVNDDTLAHWQKNAPCTCTIARGI